MSSTSHSVEGPKPTKVKDRTPLLIDQSNGVNVKNTSRSRRILLASIIVFIVMAVIVTFITILYVFGESDSDDTINWQNEFLSIASTERLRSNSEYFTKYSHVAGTADNYHYAEEIHRQFIEMGYNATIVNYTDTVLSEFKSSSLKQLNPSSLDIIQHFNLSEKIIEQDPTSNTSLRHEAWLGYSPSGNITAYLIYINFGTPKDFDLLFNKMNYSSIINNYITNNNLSFIGIMRYGGGITRGLKVRLAAKYNLSAAILFSDPIDYGDKKGDIFPNGPWLPRSGFQRGAASAIELCFGNPSIKRVTEKCNMTQEYMLSPLPVIPIGYTNAYILLSQLNSLSVNNVSTQWQGGFNFTYHIGGEIDDNGILVELQIETELITKTTANVIAQFNDSFIEDYVTYKDESIMIGNHRDAWVYGAADPISGTTVMLEIAKSFSEIINKGWRPKRNIKFGSWDGEEFNLIGSAQFVENENNQNFILKQLIAYLNVDTAVSGHYLYFSGDPMMEYLIHDCMKQIYYPMNYEFDGQNLYQVWENGIIQNNMSLIMLPLGSGSDYSAYVHEYGIPSFDSGFTGLNGVYHSIYDGFTWMSKEIDPTYNFAKAHTQFLGLLSFKFLNDDIIQFNITNLYHAILRWTNEDIQMLINENQCIIDNSLTDILFVAIDNFGEAAIVFDERVTNIDNNDDDMIRKYNEGMRILGSLFIYNDGLPQRKLYKNMLFAANLDSGYAHQVLPYIAYAIKYDCNSPMLQKAYNVTTRVIYDAAYHLNNYDFV